mmetsp:Transcript_63260/g.196270  ORF Transcript_63260/g.196270 Transcript_63260/m.196270 type:complete len:165 (-) Transcript_63260:278-772(-)
MSQPSTKQVPFVSVVGQHLPFMAQCPGAQTHLPETHIVWPWELAQASVDEQLLPVSEEQAAGVAKQRPCCEHQPVAHLQLPQEQVVGPSEASQLRKKQLPLVLWVQEAFETFLCSPAAGAARTAEASSAAATSFAAGVSTGAAEAAFSEATGAAASLPFCSPRS